MASTSGSRRAIFSRNSLVSMVISPTFFSRAISIALALWD
jgi:hypothetical protein